jgi:hypothetical protein
MTVPAIHIVTARPCQGLQQERTADGVRGRNHHLVCLGVAGLLLHMLTYLIYTDTYTIFVYYICAIYIYTLSNHNPKKTRF